MTTDTPVFDNSHVGAAFGAIRPDEPGAEDLWRKKVEHDPGHSRGEKIRDPDAEFRGDWSWKPDRYWPDEGKEYTAEEVEAVYPGREYVPGMKSIHFPEQS